MLKTVFISDTHLHEYVLKIEECDLLIHSGDIDARSLKDVVLFNQWLKKIKAKHKIFVPGNHDFFFESHMDLCKETLTEAIVLNNEEITIEGFKIWGSPITPTFFNWAFMQDRGDRIKKYWDLIPNDTDILVTHGPPMNILDYVPRGGNVGCYDLLRAVERVKPLIHAFGHIHEGYGTELRYWYEDMKDSGKNTTFINSAIMDGDYDPVNKPITIVI